MEKIYLDIKKAMAEQKITEQFLSEKTGIPQSTIHRLVTGQNKKLDLSKIRVIQRVLGMAGVSNFDELASRQDEQIKQVGERPEEYDKTKNADDALMRQAAIGKILKLQGAKLARILAHLAVEEESE